MNDAFALEFVVINRIQYVACFDSTNFRGLCNYKTSEPEMSVNYQTMFVIARNGIVSPIFEIVIKTLRDLFSKLTINYKRLQYWYISLHVSVAGYAFAF